MSSHATSHKVTSLDNIHIRKVPVPSRSPITSLHFSFHPLHSSSPPSHSWTSLPCHIQQPLALTLHIDQPQQQGFGEIFLVNSTNASSSQKCGVGWYFNALRAEGHCLIHRLMPWGCGARGSHGRGVSRVVSVLNTFVSYTFRVASVPMPLLSPSSSRPSSPSLATHIHSQPLNSYSTLLISCHQ